MNLAEAGNDPIKMFTLAGLEAGRTDLELRDMYYAVKAETYEAAASMYSAFEQYGMRAEAIAFLADPPKYLMDRFLEPIN